MATELRVPKLGESIAEVQIGAWLVAPGQAVRRDQPLVVIETDKATVEIPAPADGSIQQVLKAEGERALVGEAIGWFEAGAAGEAPALVPSPAAAPIPVRATPAARQAMREHDVPAAAVTPSGPRGQMLKQDVLESAARRDHAAPPPPSTPSVPAAPPIVADGPRTEETVPMSLLRQRVAERLKQAQNTAAMLTTFNEIDMSNVVALRRQHQESFQKRHGIKLGFLSFFVRAAVDALRLVPELNAEIRERSIVYRHYQDIGVAVGGGRGLVVPVLRNAERLGFAEIEQAIADFSQRAQANSLRLDELQGGTFTISNGGVYGSLLSTPILNPPQSGILGLHAIQDRPVARDGQVVIRPMMYVALSYDHRIVDGREAVTFLKRIKEAVEEPARMLLEV